MKRQIKKPKARAVSKNIEAGTKGKNTLGNRNSKMNQSGRKQAMGEMGKLTQTGY